MKFGKYTCTARLKKECFLPVFKGSTFRGTFGWSLKRAVCIFKDKECAECMVNKQCIYAQTFEPLRKEGTDGAISAYSHPYCIEPPEEEKNYWPAGATFEFSLLLFGQANEYLPYYIFAMEKMGQSGIGRCPDRSRCPFSLISVKNNGLELYDPRQSSMINQPEPVVLDVKNMVAEQCSGLKVNLLSPLRIQADKSFQLQLPFHILIRGILRRISSLFALYGDGEPDLDYKGLIQRAGVIGDDSSDLRWVDHLRYSNRQKKQMFMGGMTGNVPYKGDLAEFIPLLELGSLLHIGKQTSFGLGRFECEQQ
jgi:hypothetical protein